MKKTLLTAILGLALVGTAFADCAYTAGNAGSWTPWKSLPSGGRTAGYTCGSCYDVLNATYCTSFTQSPTYYVEDYDATTQQWKITLQGGSCTDHGTAGCQIGG